MTDGDGRAELELLGLALLVQLVEAGLGDHVVTSYAAERRLIVEQDGRAIAIVSVVAYPITDPDGV